MTFTTPHGSVRYRLPWSWTAFDYRTLCQGLWAQCGAARFETAKVEGRTGDVVHTDRGDLRAPLIVDALGWRRVLGRRAATSRPRRRSRAGWRSTRDAGRRRRARRVGRPRARPPRLRLARAGRRRAARRRRLLRPARPRQAADARRSPGASEAEPSATRATGSRTACARPPTAGCSAPATAPGTASRCRARGSAPRSTSGSPAGASCRACSPASARAREALARYAAFHDAPRAGFPPRAAPPAAAPGAAAARAHGAVAAHGRSALVTAPSAGIWTRRPPAFASRVLNPASRRADAPWAMGSRRRHRPASRRSWPRPSSATRRSVENLPAVAYVAAFDEDGTLLSISPQVEALLGPPPEAFLAEDRLLVAPHPPRRRRARGRRERPRVPRGRRASTASTGSSPPTARERAGLGARRHRPRRAGAPLYTQGVIVDITELPRGRAGAARRARPRPALPRRRRRDRPRPRPRRARRAAQPRRARAPRHDDGELLGRDWFDAVRPEATARARARGFDRLVDGGERADRARLREPASLTRDGRAPHGRLAHTPLRDDDGPRHRRCCSSARTSPSAARPRSRSPTSPTTTRSPGCPTARCSRSTSTLALARAARAGAARRAAVPRPRRLQARQRLARPRRPATSCCARSPGGCGERRAPATCWPARAATSSCCCSPTSTRDAAAAAARGGRGPARRAGRAVHGRRRRVPASARRSASRCSRATPHDADDAAAPRRRRDVPGQGRRPRRRRRVYARRRRTTPLERLSLTARLRRALDGDELVLHYQPIVVAADRRSSTRSRRCCAGRTPSAGWSRPASSSRSPRRPG